MTDTALEAPAPTGDVGELVERLENRATEHWTHYANAVGRQTVSPIETYLDWQAATALRSLISRQPTSDVGEMVQRLREMYPQRGDGPKSKLVWEAADFIESANSRLAELEKMHVAACGNADTNYAKLQAAEQALRAAREALAPFAALIDRRWTDKAESIECVRKGGFISELQAVELKHVLAARAALTGAGEEGE